jgi:hypothetical protein
MPAPKTTDDKHTHVRVKVQDFLGSELSEENLVSMSKPDEALAKVKNDNKFKRYTERYIKDKDADTEFYEYSGVTNGNYRLTVYVFSCYCVPLNVNQAPPF